MAVALNPSRLTSLLVTSLFASFSMMINQDLPVLTHSIWLPVPRPDHLHELGTPYQSLDAGGDVGPRHRVGARQVEDTGITHDPHRDRTSPWIGRTRPMGLMFRWVFLHSFSHTPAERPCCPGEEG